MRRVEASTSTRFVYTSVTCHVVRRGRDRIITAGLGIHMMATMCDCACAAILPFILLNHFLAASITCFGRMHSVQHMQQRSTGASCLHVVLVKLDGSSECVAKNAFCLPQRVFLLVGLVHWSLVGLSSFSVNPRPG